MTGGNEQFRRASRLTKAVEFRRVFSRPQVFQDRYFRVLCRASALDQGRLGLAVSKKACARAVDRNRLKRVIRESFRKHQHALANLAGFQSLFLGGAPDEDALGFDDLLRDMGADGVADDPANAQATRRAKPRPPA